MVQDIRVFAPITAEMRFWQRLLRPVLQPPEGALRRPLSALRFLMVTPTAHAAWLSSSFQLYLYAIFHQTPLARLGHRLGFPITIAALCAALAPLHPGPAPSSLGEALRTPSAALIGSVALAAYHAYVAAFFRSALLGIVVVPLGFALYALGVGWAWSLGNLGSEPGLLWVPPAVALLSSAGVSASHAWEPRLPPRVSGSDAWVGIRRFVCAARDPLRVARRALRVFAAFLGGVLDELWGAPRLFVLGVLRDLEWLGSRTEESLRTQRLAEEALRSGDPALDYIGTGGGAPPPG